MTSARFEFIDVPEGLPAGAVAIRDIGAEEPEIWEDAEAVTAALYRIIQQLKEPDDTRFFYANRSAEISELIHSKGKFIDLVGIDRRLPEVPYNGGN